MNSVSPVTGCRNCRSTISALARSERIARVRSARIAPVRGTSTVSTTAHRERRAGRRRSPPAAASPSGPKPGAHHHHELAVGVEPVERVQRRADAGERQHDDQHLRQHQPRELEEHPRALAAGDHGVDQPHRLGQPDHAGEDQQEEAERRDQLPQDVAVQSGHARLRAPTVSRRRSGQGPGKPLGRFRRRNLRETAVTAPLQTAFAAADPSKIAGAAGRLVVFAAGAGRLDPLARRVDRLTRGAVGRLVGERRLRQGQGRQRPRARLPAGSRRRGGAGGEAAARGRRSAEARLAGAAIAGFNASVPLTVLAGAPGARRRGGARPRAARLRVPRVPDARSPTRRRRTAP